MVVKYLKMLLVLGATLVFFSVPGETGAESGAVVASMAAYGPAPINLWDSAVGRYQWVIAKVDNPTAVPLQARVSVSAAGLPDEGCSLLGGLIIPGSETFNLEPLESKWVLYRLRYQCHSPADAGVYAVNLDFCVEDVGGSWRDCKLSSRGVITDWGATALGIDVDPYSSPTNAAADLGSLETCRPVGDIFNVDLYITNVQDLLGWGGILNYDPAVIKVLDIDVWQFQGQNPMSLVKFFGDDMPDTDGSFEAVGVDMGPISAGDSGTGVLARITLEAIGPGVSPMTLTQLQVVNEAGVYIGDTNGDSYFDGAIHNAQVAVDLDPDGDGLATPCGDPVADNPDADNDGVSDLVEVEVGSNPLDPADTPTLETTCPQGQEPVYDEQGNFMGCSSIEGTAKTCDPANPDYDRDGLEDSCDSSEADPTNPDGDGDTVPDPFEAYVGTDPRDGCSDDPTDPAWPFDINTDTWANDADIQLFYTSGVYGSQAGDDNFDQRYDLNADGAVNDQDIQLYTDTGALNTQCSEAGQQAGSPGGGTLLERALGERQGLEEGGVQPAYWGNWPPFTLYERMGLVHGRIRACFKKWGVRICGNFAALVLRQTWYYTGSHIFTWQPPDARPWATFPCSYSNLQTAVVWVSQDWSARSMASIYVSCRTPQGTKSGSPMVAIDFYGDGNYTPWKLGFQ